MQVILLDGCECLNITYCRPKKSFATRGLSVFDVTLRTIYMFNVFVIFCFSFLSKPGKKLYQSMLNTIYYGHDNETSDEIKTRI